MSTATEVKRTPGAIRAGNNIAERFRKALPGLPPTTAATLAAIIDGETCASEMLEALEECEIALRVYDEVPHESKANKGLALARAQAAIRKARGGQ